MVAFGGVCGTISEAMCTQLRICVQGATPLPLTLRYGAFSLKCPRTFYWAKTAQVISQYFCRVDPLQSLIGLYTSPLSQIHCRLFQHIAMANAFDMVRYAHGFYRASCCIVIYLTEVRSWINVLNIHLRNMFRLLYICYGPRWETLAHGADIALTHWVETKWPPLCRRHLQIHFLI